MNFNISRLLKSCLIASTIGFATSMPSLSAPGELTPPVTCAKTLCTLTKTATNGGIVFYGWIDEFGNSSASLHDGTIMWYAPRKNDIPSLEKACNIIANKVKKNYTVEQIEKFGSICLF